MRRGGVGAAFPAGFCRILLEMWISGFSEDIARRTECDVFFGCG